MSVLQDKSQFQPAADAGPAAQAAPQVPAPQKAPCSDWELPEAPLAMPDQDLRPAGPALLQRLGLLLRLQSQRTGRA